MSYQCPNGLPPEECRHPRNILSLIIKIFKKGEQHQHQHQQKTVNQEVKK